MRQQYILLAESLSVPHMIGLIEKYSFVKG
jgi:hypothetical protein